MKGGEACPFPSQDQETVMTTATEATATQYLTFNLGEEVFALDIGQVKEVLDFATATRIPRTPDFVRGVINLRGIVVPVVDLRLKFGMSKTEQTVSTCVIITEIVVDGEPTVVGALADSVLEVIDLDAGQIEPAPRLGTRLNSEFISGMSKQHDRFIILLDIDRIFTSDEIAAIAPVENGIGVAQ
jgi:purine-binding chemotaxis protein CheW